MVQHDFKVAFQWQGGRDQSGQLNGDIIKETFSIPSSLGGTGIGTNPDELLVSAAGSCFIISLAATLERAHFKIKSLKLTSIGTAEYRHNRFSMKQIAHNVDIYVEDSETKDKLLRRIDRLLQTADTNCMVSNSLRGNVTITTQSHIYLISQNV